MVYLQYEKVVKDQVMPKDLIGRRKCCVEWMHRPSTPISPNESDDDGPVSNKDSLTYDIAGLLGLVSNALGQVNSGNHKFYDGTDGEF